MNPNDAGEWTQSPWLPYRAIQFIRDVVEPDIVFEWGCGGSTLLFAKLADVVVSVESDPGWYAAVGHELALRGLEGNVSLKLVPWEAGEIGLDKSDPAHYKSGSTELGPVNFRRYASAIDEFEAFDLVLVDGFARASCLAHAASKVISGGWLALDNTDRDYYLEKTLHLFDGWERVDFYGYGPILAYPWRCTLFHNWRKDGT